MEFEFATAGRLVFGGGAFARLGTLAAELGSRALLVGGKSAQRVDEARALLAGIGIEAQALSIASEPTIDDARRGVELARSSSANLVIAVGGGSPLDAGKAIAALVENGGD